VASVIFGVTTAMVSGCGGSSAGGSSPATKGADAAATSDATGGADGANSEAGGACLPDAGVPSLPLTLQVTAADPAPCVLVGALEPFACTFAYGAACAGTLTCSYMDASVQATLTGSGTFTLNGNQMIGTFSGTLTQTAEPSATCSYQFTGLLM
jgi:hypothetical protein